jgi:hypothetical protein
MAKADKVMKHYDVIIELLIKASDELNQDEYAVLLKYLMKAACQFDTKKDD